MADRRSHDQKRKAKLAKRAEKERASADPLPYSGKTYQADRWVPHVFATESAIYETIGLSGRRLTNAQVRTALTQLIGDIRKGEPALLPEGTPDVAFVQGGEAEYLIWNIRRHWRQLVAKQGPVSNDDLVGILRTLLYSIVAHGANTGQDRGYVAFLEGFMRRMLP